MYSIGEKPRAARKVKPKNIWKTAKKGIVTQRLFTSARVSIDKFVEENRTELFSDLFKANDYARVIRSYTYIVYDFNGRFSGYAVPK